MWLNNINKTTSKHEEEIIKHFSKENVFINKNDKRFKDYNLTLICFTNRCGSNLLSELMGQTNINIAGENLNFDAVINNSQKYKFDNFSDYFFWLVKSFSVDNNFAIKCSTEQLLFLTRHGFTKEIFKSYNYLLIKRKNILDQVISFAIASQTNQWTSYQKPTHEFKELTNSNFNVEPWLNLIPKIYESEAIFKTYFEAYECHWLETYYEEIIENTEDVMKKIFLHLNLDVKKVLIEKAKTKKQSTNKGEIMKKIKKELKGRVR